VPVLVGTEPQRRPAAETAAGGCPQAIVYSDPACAWQESPPIGSFGPPRAATAARPSVFIKPTSRAKPSGVAALYPLPSGGQPIFAVERRMSESNHSIRRVRIGPARICGKTRTNQAAVSLWPGHATDVPAVERPSNNTDRTKPAADAYFTGTNSVVNITLSSGISFSRPISMNDCLSTSTPLGSKTPSVLKMAICSS
jgi:hypothetical protein